ncbi:amidohydrolase family protein, partial [Candidatus Latescibacterota bacterium]
KFNVQKAVAMAKKYPDIIVGFKTAHYWGGKNTYDEIHTPWASVDSVLAAGRIADLPVMIDWTPRPPQDGFPARTYHDLIFEKMRPGDIRTHLFTNTSAIAKEVGEKTIINSDIIEGQKRGRIFDVGHGGGFRLRNAVPFVKQGYYPNSISTDLHAGCSSGPAINMMYVMSKFLCLGIPLEDVIRLSTNEPARIINHPELGSLTVGHTADIAVIELLKGDFGYIDNGGGKINGDKRLQNVMTLFGGNIVFDLNGLSHNYLENIPKDSSYWARPPEDW